jgi:hypothetical protein
MRVEFFVVELKAQQDIENRKKRQAITQAAGRRYCCRSGYTAMNFSISIGLSYILYTQLAIRMFNSDLQRTFRIAATA